MEISFPETANSRPHQSRGALALLEYCQATLTTINDFLEGQASRILAVSSPQEGRTLSLALLGTTLLRVEEVRESWPLFSQERVDNLVAFYEKDAAGVCAYFSHQGLLLPTAVISQVATTTQGPTSKFQAVYARGENFSLENLLEQER